MKFGKKAVIFEGVIFFVILIILTTAFFTLYNKQGKFPDKYKIGERQFSLLQTYQQAEKALFYIDQSAKYSLQQAVYELSKSGGIPDADFSDEERLEVESNENLLDNTCGNFYGYPIWYSSKKDESGSYIRNPCFDLSKVEDSLKYFFNKDMNQYLQIYPYNIPSDNFNYDIKGSLEITGKAKGPIKFDILKEPEKAIGLTTYEKKIQDEKNIGKITTKPGIKVSYQYALPARDRRQGAVVDRVILHHTGDDQASKTYKTLKDRGLSVHYIIDRDGTIDYVVDESKIAYHAAGWNTRSIGIEIVNTGYRDMDYTEEQYASINNLGKDIASRWPSIKFDNEHVIAHYQASTTGKWDPSPNFDWSKIELPSHPTLLAEGKKAPKDFGYA